MTIHVRVPAVAAQADPTVELRPVYVEEWADALPFADPVSLLRELHRALFRFNRTPVRPAVRLTLAETYLRPYRFLLELEEKHGAIHSIAAFERNWAETDATRRIAVELGYAFKHVVADTVGGKGSRRAGKQLARALQRAVLCLAHTLMHSYHEYLPTPKHLWTELAEVYGYARAQGMHAAANPAAGLPDDFAVPLESLYKRILLVSLVDPHHLAYGEVWKVYELMGACADAAQLTEVGPAPRTAGLFVLDDRRDQRPIPYDEAGSDTPHERLHLLNARPVIQALHRQAKVIRARAGAGTDRAARLERMLNTLGRPPKRRDERTPGDGRVSVAMGFSSVHHFTGGVPVDPPAGAAGSRGAEDVVADSDTGPRVGFGRGHYAAEYWELANRGRGGIGVLRHIRPNQAIGVGELIAVELEGGEEPGPSWSIGVVRWMNVENAGEYQAGVQILARSAKPAHVIIETPDGDAPARAIALLLAAPAAAGAGSLILPAGTFAGGRTLLVESPEGTLRVRCATLAEATARFELATVEAIG